MSIQSAAHTRNTTTTHLSAGRSFTTWQTLTPLSLCQLTLCQCTTGKVSTIFTWTTKRNVCCDKTKKIEMDLHLGHPFAINTGIILFAFIYFLTKTFLFRKFESIESIEPLFLFFLYSSLNLDTELKNMAQN